MQQSTEELHPARLGFDLSIAASMTTLTRSACICVTSKGQGKSDLSATKNDLQTKAFFKTSMNTIPEPSKLFFVEDTRTRC